MKKPLLLTSLALAAMMMAACAPAASSTTTSSAPSTTSQSSAGTTSNPASSTTPAESSTSASSESSSSSSSPEVKNPTVALDAAEKDIIVGAAEPLTLTATVTDFTGVPTWSIDDEAAALITPAANGLTATVEGITGGATAILTVTAGTATAHCTIRVHYDAPAVPVYDDVDLYKADATKVGTYPGLWYAMDEMLTQQLAGAYITKAGDAATVLYTRTTNGFNYLTKSGVYNDYTDTHVTNGQSGWWSSMSADLEMYTQKTVNCLLTAAGNDAKVGTFQSRATDWDQMKNWAGGYYAAADPNGAWNGWQASVNKAAVTTAQYSSWADSTGYLVDTLSGHYSLKNNIIRPSQDKNQPATADIWFGTQALTDNPMMMGITFDAGTADECKDLANGTKRNWYMYTETQAIDGGLASVLPGTRVVDTENPIGFAKWDALDKVWYVNFDADIAMTYKYSDKYDGANFGLGLKVTVAGKDYTSSWDAGKVINLDSVRITYGINFTVDAHKNSRRVPNLDCGAGWYNLVQGDLFAKQKDGSDVTIANDAGDQVPQNFNFAVGRAVNGGHEMGLYGGDCVTATKDTENSTMSFAFAY